ncbi:MAG TPA: hypothetical protein VJQ60_13065 [Arthrobacter sp.]|nr:hypothetical protein [Arthrobacter sp.]
MTESQSPQDGSFAAPHVQNPAVTDPYGDTDPNVFRGGSGTGSGSVTPEDAKAEAAGVADAVGEAAGNVADTAKTEATQVAREVRANARELMTQTKGELTDQAATQQQKVAKGLRSISDDLATMANASEDGGVAADLVHQVAERSASVAEWLENRDPGAVLHEMKNFARRRPGAFLLLAAGAGVIAGRLGRGLAENASDGTGTGTYRGTPGGAAGFSPAAGQTVPPPAVELPGPAVTNAGYQTPAPGFVDPVFGSPGIGADPGTAPGTEPGAFPGSEPGSASPDPEKIQGDPLGTRYPDDPEYGGSR